MEAIGPSGSREALRASSPLEVVEEGREEREGKNVYIILGSRSCQTHKRTCLPVGGRRFLQAAPKILSIQFLRNERDVRRVERRGGEGEGGYLQKYAYHT